MDFILNVFFINKVNRNFITLMLDGSSYLPLVLIMDGLTRASLMHAPSVECRLTLFALRSLIDIRENQVLQKFRIDKFLRRALTNLIHCILLIWIHNLAEQLGLLRFCVRCMNLLSTYLLLRVWQFTVLVIINWIVLLKVGVLTLCLVLFSLLVILGIIRVHIFLIILLRE